MKNNFEQTVDEISLLFSSQLKNNFKNLIEKLDKETQRDISIHWNDERYRKEITSEINSYVDSLFDINYSTTHISTLLRYIIMKKTGKTLL
jgi:hypothetical protein